jgi:hypothetical protein
MFSGQKQTDSCVDWASQKEFLNMNRQIFYRLALLCGVVLAVATVGWAKNYHMTSSKTVPAAAGEVYVAKEKNGNIRVDVKVKHLAKPGNLTPPANTYVVWVQQEGSQPQSQGELKVGDDLNGELKTTTPLTNFNVFITAEADSQTKTPSDQVVLQATVQQ